MSVDSCSYTGLVVRLRSAKSITVVGGRELHDPQRRALPVSSRDSERVATRKCAARGLVAAVTCESLWQRVGDQPGIGFAERGTLSGQASHQRIAAIRHEGAAPTPRFVKWDARHPTHLPGLTLRAILKLTRLRSYLTESVDKVVLQKSTPPQILQLILYCYEYGE